MRIEPPVERSDPDEAAAIEAIAASLVARVHRTQARGTPATRDAHPKHHAVVHAEFRVDDRVPAELRYGLFAIPRTYPAWIRFSNGAPRKQSDRRRDQRGMAIKLLEVAGAKVLGGDAEAATQDFVLASHPRFFIRSVRDYVEFTQASAKRPPIGMLRFFFQGAPWRWRLHELRALAGSLERANDLLGLRYWSQTPYRLGPHVVKYSARPLDPAPGNGRGDGPDFLREALAERLGAGPARFEFLVQRRSDPASMPVEDATIVWDERQAPFARVATITIAAQRFDSPAQMALAEHISYTPWHTLPEHTPLGGVNRARRVAYEAVSRTRHDLNGRPRQEPASITLADEGWETNTDGTRTAADRPGRGRS